MEYDFITLNYFKKGAHKVEKSFLDNQLIFYKFYKKLRVLELKKDFLFKVFKLFKIKLNTLNEKLFKNSKSCFLLKTFDDINLIKKNYEITFIKFKNQIISKNFFNIIFTFRFTNLLYIFLKIEDLILKYFLNNLCQRFIN